MLITKINIDDIKDYLGYEVAKMIFDNLDVRAAKVSFDALMDQGVWIDEFIDIEHPETNSMADFKPAFDASLKELDIDIPEDKEEAVIELKKEIIRSSNDWIQESRSDS